ncbi:hypothetical protein BDN72DRAFT_834480 [Pluteus cervinus]|uniref:Uncharacterized protein n=1 Tax=Pluteus cervinus TaxID=181527 RepID=A0ACD3B7J0_9AGAR|nr:hypothetical protein BDN72DRAFT_834480 [Pluteus cervinus]
MEVDSDYEESTSITFEWTLRGLRNLFETSKGDAKSKVTRSLKFGGGRWQILFYANAGAPKEGNADGGFVSLYLSCEPTAEEKEVALADSGRWVRDGVYKFSFELRNLEKNILYSVKEAQNHSFSHKTANWGWAQFARRDSIYYQSGIVKAEDAFVIVCKITSSPCPPPPPPTVPRQAVPKSLLDTVGALLDDKIYSDVEFVIPRRGYGPEHARRIWASRRLLRRAEYFDTMFGSGFQESLSANNINLSARSSADAIYALAEFEDSDDEGDEGLDSTRSDAESMHSSQSSFSFESAAAASVLEHTSDEQEMKVDGEGVDPKADGTKAANDEGLNSDTMLCGEPVIPLSRESSTTHTELDRNTSTPLHVTVVVKDVAYTTYYAILYYVYTDNIVFAPLSSSFIVRRSATPSTSNISLPLDSTIQGQAPIGKRASIQDNSSSRAEWIREWKRNNPGRPAPCSAKAAYRVADKLDLRDLKERAAQHIFKSLTIENIPYEVFSPFAAAFEDIRKVQINFFLTHWGEVRTSDSMRHVWQQIRNGRHPGFEEVWPVITSNLEFKAPTPKGTVPPNPH